MCQLLQLPITLPSHSSTSYSSFIWILLVALSEIFKLSNNNILKDNFIFASFVVKEVMYVMYVYSVFRERMSSILVFHDQISPWTLFICGREKCDLSIDNLSKKKEKTIPLMYSVHKRKNYVISTDSLIHRDLLCGIAGEQYYLLHQATKYTARQHFLSFL